MNQKNVFTALGVLLALQGIGFYVMGSKIAMDAFGDLGESGNMAAKHLMEVMGAFSFMLGLIAYTNRSNPQILLPFTLGSAILLIVTLKHVLADHINVPIYAVVTQILILLASAYLWMQNNKAKPA